MPVLARPGAGRAQLRVRVSQKNLLPLLHFHLTAVVCTNTLQKGSEFTRNGEREGLQSLAVPTSAICCSSGASLSSPASVASPSARRRTKIERDTLSTETPRERQRQHACDKWNTRGDTDTATTHAARAIARKQHECTHSMNCVSPLPARFPARHRAASPTPSGAGTQACAKAITQAQRGGGQLSSTTSFTRVASSLCHTQLARL